MNFMSILKKIGQVGQVATTVAAPFLPTSGPLGMLLKVVSVVAKGAAGTAVVVETTQGTAPGSEKMKSAQVAMMTTLPMLIQSLELSWGKDMVDEVLLTRGVMKILDGSVDVMNSLGVAEDAALEVK